MKLYLVEAPVKAASPPYWARTWVTSQADAATTRARYTSDLYVERKDIRTTPVEIDARVVGLMNLLNHVSNSRDGYFYGN